MAVYNFNKKEKKEEDIYIYIYILSERNLEQPFPRQDT